MWEGLRVRNSDCASAELKQSGRGVKEPSVWRPVLFSDQWEWLTVDHPALHGNHPRFACALWTLLKSMCVNVATYTHTHTHTHTRIYCIRVYKEMCVKVQEVHLLSDRPQQCDGCVGFWSITDVWQADELWRSHTLLPPHILPSSACLLISLGGGRKLPPFLPKRVFPSPLSFPPAPPILLCCVVLRWLRLWQVFREGNAEGEESNNLLN